MTTSHQGTYQLELDTSAFDLPFNAWASNTHSQCGEDGIIAKLIALGDVTERYFVEFGAWDGRHLSNSAALADSGWAGCFIEGDAERFKDLQASYDTRADITPVHAFVRTSGEDRLDGILTRAGAPASIGVMSIDIDGCDYQVWDSVKAHMPQICIVEFNPTIPAHVIYVQEDDSSVHRGCSLAALCRLSASKGYSLVAVTEWNAFFMPTRLCEQRNIPIYRPTEVKSRTYEAAIFHGYDGTVLVAGHRQLLWHGDTFEADGLQVLPEGLRHFHPAAPADYADRLEKFRKKS
jgi:hypothetical protein